MRLPSAAFWNFVGSLSPAGRAPSLRLFLIEPVFRPNSLLAGRFSFSFFPASLFSRTFSPPGVLLLVRLFSLNLFSGRILCLPGASRSVSFRSIFLAGRFSLSKRFPASLFQRDVFSYPKRSFSGQSFSSTGRFPRRARFPLFRKSPNIGAFLGDGLSGFLYNFLCQAVICRRALSQLIIILNRLAEARRFRQSYGTRDGGGKYLSGEVFFHLVDDLLGQI